MNNIIQISSLDLPELKIYRNLTKSNKKSGHSEDSSIFIAEGIKTTEIALAAGLEPVSFLMEEKHAYGKAGEIMKTCPNIPAYLGPSDVISSLTGYELTRGFLCAMKRPAPNNIEEICFNAKRLVILENVADASNVGAIFRSAAALGMDGIILSPTCCDPLYRKSVRTSMGTVFQIPWVKLSCGWPEKAMTFIQSSGFHRIGLAVDKNALTIDDSQLHEYDKLAILFGNEGVGLSSTTISLCDSIAYIPMYNSVNSLNVAASASIAFWVFKNK